MVVSWPPFVHLDLNTDQLHLRKLAALAPLAAGAAYCNAGGFLARTAVMAAAAALLKMALVRLRVSRADWSQALYETALLSLLAPAALPWQMAWICPVLVFLLRWLLGGRDGVVPLNVPALILAALVVQLGGDPAALGRWPAPPWFGSASGYNVLTRALPAVLAAVAAVLLMARVCKFVFLAAFAVPVMILSGLAVYTTGAWGTVLNEQMMVMNWLLVTAAFLAADEASTPRAGWAQAAQGLAAAAVFLLFARRGELYQAVAWSAFIPSLAAPWLDAAAAYRRPLPLFPAGTGIQE